MKNFNDQVSDVMNNAYHEQLHLFKSLFKGRSDVFATYWEKEGKIGYMPMYSYDPYRFMAHKRNGQGDQLLYQSAEELLGDALANGNYKHQRHLRYLSEHHNGSILKIRFVLSPFAFVFLLAGEHQYHIIMETLDTEEATYIWHVLKSIAELKNALQGVEGDLNKIRNEGRQEFLKSSPVHFSRILHDYSDDRKGFVVWRDDLEQRLV